MSGHDEPVVEVTGLAGPRQAELLTPEALDFVAWLDAAFAGRRRGLLVAREARCRLLTTGVEELGFRPETRHIREDPSWRVAGPGPVPHDHDAKMVDFEDATSPTWANIVNGQLAVRDALSGRAEPGPATIVVRPRGWHLNEAHLRVGGRPAAAALVDVGLHLFHNGRRLAAVGAGPYFHLPKLENHHEARLWDEVFRFAQDLLGLPYGTIRATVLIETITAAFEMEEILFELREHCVGLKVGRRDYLFSIIKNLGDRDRGSLLPDRSQMTMAVPFLRAYGELLVRTCHRRGAQAFGEMSAFAASADPGRQVTARDLLDLSVPGGRVTERGIRDNVRVVLCYLDAWLRGSGTVAVGGVTADTATAEVARCQLWQWIHLVALLDDGRPVTRGLVERLVAQEHRALALELGAGNRLSDAVTLLTRTALGDDLPDFFTPAGYREFLAAESTRPRARPRTAWDHPLPGRHGTAPASATHSAITGRTTR
ncbi:malate synthase [Parafrankia sp. FMc2]|uniref:malate synthase n=1 Tax=Parafrankia sp. FMc2 TaxID=3233196 RepID=UPI0034D4386F